MRDWFYYKLFYFVFFGAVGCGKQCARGYALCLRGSIVFTGTCRRIGKVQSVKELESLNPWAPPPPWKSQFHGIVLLYVVLGALDNNWLCLYGVNESFTTRASVNACIHLLFDMHIWLRGMTLIVRRRFF